MQRHMICIPPSKLQHAQPNAELTQGARSGSLVNLLAAPVLSLGRGGDVKIKLAPWWGLGFWSVSWMLLFGQNSGLLGDATRGYLYNREWGDEGQIHAKREALHQNPSNDGLEFF